MKQSLALLILSCVLVAQDKPAAEAPKPAAVEKAAESKPKIKPINIRDELIELIHQLKKEANASPSSLWGKVTADSQVIASVAIAEHAAKSKSKTEAQRLLLHALVELAKEAEKANPTVVEHSTSSYTGR
jgi:spore coat polysaccharide biosynthesis predicted glycosyltransferase SpsG